MKIEASHFHLEAEAAEIAQFVRRFCKVPVAHDAEAAVSARFAALQDGPPPTVEVGPKAQAFSQLIDAHGGEDDLLAIMDLDRRVLYVSHKHRALVDEAFRLKKVTDELWVAHWHTPFNSHNSTIVDLQDLLEFDRSTKVGDQHLTALKDRRCKAPGCIKTNAGGSVKPIFPPWGVECEQWSGSTCTIQKVGGLVQHWPNDPDCPDDWNKWQLATVNARGCWR